MVPSIFCRASRTPTGRSSDRWAAGFITYDLQLGVYDAVVQDLVGQTLLLVIPKRPQEIENARDTAGEHAYDLSHQIAHECHTSTDRLTSGIGYQLDVLLGLTDRLPRPGPA